MTSSKEAVCGDEEAKKSIVVTVLPGRVTATEGKMGNTSCLTVVERDSVTTDPGATMEESVVGDGSEKTEIEDGTSNLAVIFEGDKSTGPVDMQRASFVLRRFIGTEESGKSSKRTTLKDEASNIAGVQKKTYRIDLGK